MPHVLGTGIANPNFMFMSLEKRRTLLRALQNIQQLHGVVGQDIATRWPNSDACDRSGYPSLVFLAPAPLEPVSYFSARNAFASRSSGLSLSAWLQSATSFA